MCLLLGNPVGVMAANALAPVIVNKNSDIPFMVGSWLQTVLFTYTDRGVYEKMKHVSELKVHVNLFTPQL